MYTEVLFSHNLRYVKWLYLLFLCIAHVSKVLGVTFFVVIKKKAFPKYLQEEPYWTPHNKIFPFWKIRSKTAWRKPQENRRDDSIFYRPTISGFVRLWGRLHSGFKDGLRLRLLYSEFHYFLTCVKKQNSCSFHVSVLFQYTILQEW